MKTRGLTLIEMLAVLVILALAATLALGMSGTTATQKRLAAESAVMEALSRARTIAMNHGGAMVEFGERVVVRAARQNAQGDGSQEWSALLPQGWSTTLVGEKGGATLFIDGIGCSRDAQVILQSPEGRGRLRLEGLTGRLTRDLDTARGLI